MEIKVQHNETEQRFEAEIAGSLAYLGYSVRGDQVFFEHTFVPEELRGRGVAAVIVREGLEEARRRGWKVVPSCSYVAAFIARHREFGERKER